MIIDSHHHFWNYAPEAYDWIEPGMEVLMADHGPKELAPRIVEAGIDAVISVQARTCLEENDDLLTHAEIHDWIAGVVGWVDPTRDDLAETLERYAGHQKFVGVREVLQGMRDDAYCLRADFNRGIDLLRDFGLVYDILIFHRHLPHAIAFVDRHPSQVFVLDHVAKPEIRSSSPDPAWRSGLSALAERENVFCKISGMVTEVVGDIEITDGLLRPYYELALEAFGPERLMFGSDWPVCRLRSEYGDWKRMVDEFAGELSDSERESLLGGTAASAYGLR